MSEGERACIITNSHRREREKKMREISSQVLTELRLEGKLCDAVIKVGDAEFNAHKIVLCSCSLYFHTLFTGAGATSDKRIYTIPGVSPEIMDLIINYAYTRSVAVTESNVVDVLAAADQFMVPGIIQTCCFFLEDQLCPSNCINIWRLVDFYHCPDLRHKVFLYILHNFEEVASVSEELLEVSAPQLATLIENDQLNVARENKVFDVLMRWINHLPDERRAHLSVLLPKVRLGLMTSSYLQHNVLDNAAVKESVELTLLVTDAVLESAGVQLTGAPRSAYSNLLTRPRLPSAILLVTGGKQRHSYSTSLEAYDARANCWVTVNTSKVWRSNHGAAVLNNFVYLIGGCVHEVFLNTVQRFDPMTCTWCWMAHMNFCRSDVCVAVLNGLIYAMGGYSGQFSYKCVECYNPETNRWTLMAPMRVRRSGASAAALNGKIYICGGYNGCHSLSTAECYNPNTNQWTMIVPMRCCRSGLGVAAYKGHIYAVGGTTDSSICLRSAEVYNPQTNRWAYIPPMAVPRCNFGIEVVDNQLFVVGGYSCSRPVLVVERYDEELGLWCRAAQIEAPRSGLRCCVLHGLYGVAENLFPRGPLLPPSVEEAAGRAI